MCKKICPECGTEFETNGNRGKPRTFCSDTCKARHAARKTARGKALASIALGWRDTRGSGDLGKFLFAEMTSMLDNWNAEDLKRVGGKIRAREYAAGVVQFNEQNPQWSLKYSDRQNGQ